MEDLLPDDPLPVPVPRLRATEPAAVPASIPDAEAESEPARPARPPEPLISTPLPRALAFTVCPTLREFLAQHADDPELVPLERRLHEVRIPPDDQSFFATYPDTLHLVAVVNPHLPDTPAVLPLWVRMAAACPRAELRVVGDDSPVLLHRLLDDEVALDLETLELPALLIFDDEWHLQAHWGPRPHAAEPSIDEWLAHHPDYERLVQAEAQGMISPNEIATLADLHMLLMLQMRIWYNSGLDMEGSAELHALLASLHDDTETLA
jgi:hypothetical protein